MTITRYAICHVYGPISHEIPASATLDEADDLIAVKGRGWIDSACADLDDALDIDLSGYSDGDLDTLVEARGTVLRWVDEGGRNCTPVVGGWRIVEISA